MQRAQQPSCSWADWNGQYVFFSFPFPLSLSSAIICYFSGNFNCFSCPGCSLAENLLVFYFPFVILGLINGDGSKLSDYVFAMSVYHVRFGYDIVLEIFK